LERCHVYFACFWGVHIRMCH